jgi:hypothetical protein
MLIPRIPAAIAIAFASAVAAAQNPVTAVTPSTTPATTVTVKKTAPTHRPATKRPAHKKPTPAIKPVAATPALPAAAPFSQNPILSLRGNARALIVFAPDTKTLALRQQMELLDKHTLELTQNDTVFVPIITIHHGPEDVFPGENLNSGTYRDQLSARQKFGLKYNDFAVIILDKNGNETFRSRTPVSVADLKSHLQ